MVRRRADGKYAPLREYLAAATDEEMTLTFGEIEAVMGDVLPPSAHVSRSWWSSTVHAPHYDSWYQAGWRVAAVDLRTQLVTFVRQSSPPDSTT
jgi:hypothetical protein